MDLNKMTVAQLKKKCNDLEISLTKSNGNQKLKKDLVASLERKLNNIHLGGKKSRSRRRNKSRSRSRSRRKSRKVSRKRSRKSKSRKVSRKSRSRRKSRKATRKSRSRRKSRKVSLKSSRKLIKNMKGGAATGEVNTLTALEESIAIDTNLELSKTENGEYQLKSGSNILVFIKPKKKKFTTKISKCF